MMYGVCLKVSQDIFVEGVELQSQRCQPRRHEDVLGTEETRLDC